MPTQSNLIRYHIAGRWSADDFSQLLRSANDIYNLTVILSADLLRDSDIRSEMFPIDRRNVRKIAARATNQPWLDVKRITYSSPGSIDLLGLAAVTGHVKEFTIDLLNRFQTRKFRKLELGEKLRLAEKSRFDDEMERNNQLALAKHNETLRALEVREYETRIEKRKLRNRALQLTNLDTEGEFVRKMVPMLKENDLSQEQIKKIGTWLDSRASSMRELAELNQVVDAEILKSD